MSDSIRLADNLKAVGGDVKLDIWNSMWHVWHAIPELPEAEWALNEIGKYLRNTLGVGD